jgi:hypothetical protein
MSQGTLVLLGQLEWEDSGFWGQTSKCRRFSIRSQTIDGKTDHTLWRRGRDGKVIPINLGTFDTFEQAVLIAETAKLQKPQKRPKDFL